MHETDPNPRPKGMGKTLAVILLLVVLVGAGWAWWEICTGARNLERTQDALQLQVLTSRLGAAALEAEYGHYEAAREVMSGVYDGIQNYGIEQGSLPENFAQVLATRDEIITALARAEAGVRDRLVELFFRLQIPVDTRLDPEFIIPAADSGIGMEPPTRLMESAPGMGADTLSPAPDTLTPPRESVPVPVDTSGVAPPDTTR